jgi:hyperpolarization activated cyclic nucleotide-gated potassium channel 1
MPQVYKVILGCKLIRLIGIKGEIDDLLKRILIPIDFRAFVRLFIGFTFFIHMTACFWVASSRYWGSDEYGWLLHYDVLDRSYAEIYLTSFYWTIVTCTTVGYGDITPISVTEKSIAIFVIIFGVAIFSFYLSSLAN